MAHGTSGVREQLKHYISRFTKPGIGKNSNKSAVLQLIGTPWVITKADVFAGENPSMELYPSKDDPIAQALPVNAVLASYIHQG